MQHNITPVFNFPTPHTGIAAHGLYGKKRPKLAAKRRHKVKSLPVGHWSQISRAEIVNFIGSVKANKVKNTDGTIVKYGYDRFVYVNGKYYIET